MLYAATAVTAALNGLLILLLAGRVSQLRIRHQVALGDGGHAPLLRAMRTHANATEHVPIFLIMLGRLEHNAPGIGVWRLGLVFVGGRLIFSVGLLGGAFNRKRQIGATLTYLCQLVAALWLLGLFAVRGAA